MKIRKDWLVRPLPELDVMFANVKAKIADYKTAYGLTDDWIARVKLICDSFTSAYAGVVQNRATEREMNNWFEALLYGTPKGSGATAAPAFQTIALPTGTFIGIIDEFREMMRFFKANAAYTEADGANLMIVSPLEESRNPAEAVPNLKASTDIGGAIRIEYTRGNFSGLELQWRKAGAADWQLADKSTEKIIRFTPAPVTPPEKIELRGVYLLKNQRVGNWSPTYTVTVG
ncbi:MAG TPA: hypothetical protein VGD05_01645 [Pyrinomonadaceae bacterium]|jgi:hypothetical protein